MPASMTHRVSISLTDEHYRALQRLASAKRVSISWVVRDAVDRYIQDDSPLINELKESQKGKQQHV